MKELLQNHPNWRGFPGIGCRLLGQNHHGQKKLTLFTPWHRLILKVLTGISCVGIALLLYFYFDNITSATKQHETPILIWSLTLLCLLLIGGMIYKILKEQTQQQRRYYQQAGLVPLEEPQRQALRLDIVQLYDCGFWSETLEYYPLAARVAGDNYDYSRFRLASADNYLTRLEEDWGITTEQDYHEMLHELHEGMHSRLFAEQSSYRAEMLSQHLSKLTGVKPAQILDCLRPSLDNRPPALLWGFDLWRGIVMSRNAFSAGLISEEQAWTDLLKTADLVYEIFPSFDAFYTNYRIGNAFWSNNAEMAKFRLTQFDCYKKYCRWPIAQLRWPAAPGMVLSNDMFTGFGLCKDMIQRVSITKSANGEWQ